MDFALSEEDLAWQQEVRAFLSEHLTADVRAEMAAAGEIGRGPHVAGFARALAERGWNGVNWPKEYGGMAMSPIRRMLLTDEFEYARAPALEFTATAFAPLIMRYGTDANKATWLPKIRAGEVSFALGYSEPGAGTDLANLQTRAELDGEEWVINGMKIWNSGAHVCTHEWLAVRTNPDAPQHKGISVIIVPIDDPGVEISPLWTWGDVRTNQTFFTNVRVPKDNLIGEAGMGWNYIVGALDNERGALGTTGGLRRLLDDLIAECRTTVVDGEVLAERPEVRTQIAELEMELEIAQLFTLEVVSSMQNGAVATLPATIQKIMTTELRTKLGGAGMSLFGLRGQLDRADPLAPVGGEVEWTYRRAPFLRFGGGTNEVMRDIVAQRGYGLPRFGRR